jgi:hypothetical protein
MEVQGRGKWKEAERDRPLVPVYCITAECSHRPKGRPSLVSAFEVVPPGSAFELSAQRDSKDADLSPESAEKCPLAASQRGKRIKLVDL